MTEKERLRRDLLARRAALPGRAEKDEALFRVLTASPLFREARQLLCYVSVKGEPDTRRLLGEALAQGREVYAPACLPGNELVFRRIARWEDLRPAAFGLLEPDPETAAPWEPGGSALCLVPGIAFDRRGRRLGYGKGYYDRFLAAHDDLTAVGLCYDELVLPALPAEDHDRAVDLLVTPQGIVPCGPADPERERSPIP